MKPNIWRLEQRAACCVLSHCRKYQPCPVLIVWGVGSAAEEVDLANIFPNIHHARNSADREISNAMHCGT